MGGAQMNEVMPRFAPVVALLFLGTVLLIAICILVLMYGAVRRSLSFMKAGGAGTVIVASFYFLILSTVSLGSREKTLSSDQWKYFCEIDCHIAYSVVDVQRTAVLGPELKQVQARGEFFIVKVKTWFDEKSTSAHRGNGPLTPNRRKVILSDEHGKGFPEFTDRQWVPTGAGTSSATLSQPLRPGESYVAELIFDVPSGSRGLKLLITDDDPETKFLVGHENSFLHKKVYFGLSPST
jgi:hypothetical protein